MSSACYEAEGSSSGQLKVLIKKCALSWFILYNYITMHSAKNIKFATVQQAKQIYRYDNVKEKLCKAKAAIWYNKTCSRLPEDEPSGSKRVEDIKQLKIRNVNSGNVHFVGLYFIIILYNYIV
jgi:hypothetical protein